MVYYRLAGIVAFFGLLVNMIILFGAMAMFHFVLTLPGIAGIILTMGMAVDANVLIYERLREETAAGKSLAAALEAFFRTGKAPWLIERNLLIAGLLEAFGRPSSRTGKIVPTPGLEIAYQP